MIQERHPQTDSLLAYEFVADNELFIRYNAQIGHWRIWNGKFWEKDERSRVCWKTSEFLRIRAGQLIELAELKLRKDCKAQKREPTDAETLEIEEFSATIKRSLHSAKRLREVMYMTQRHQRITMDINKWDANAWSLNTPSGTVDLRTGKVNEHNPLDLITKCTAAGVSFDEPTQWLKFLHRVCDGDAERIDYLQKVLGYSLVGTTRESRMWFFYGTGANGKSVILNAAYKILGDYARWTSSSTFMRTFGQSHPTDLADLCGARLVMCGEVSPRHRWDEERIKAITGGEPIKARFMRQDFFEYTPQFTVVMAGNNKPGLEHVDEAVRRRFNLVPFDVTIPPNERDTLLGEKLEAEYPQILGWMIQGCLAWQSSNLEPPAAYRAVTDEYLTRSDAMLSWIEECAVLKPDTFTPSTELYDSYTRWTSENKERPISMRAFSSQLEDRAKALGLTKHKTAKSRGFKGIGLLDD